MKILPLGRFASTARRSLSNPSGIEARRIIQIESVYRIIAAIAISIDSDRLARKKMRQILDQNELAIANLQEVRHKLRVRIITSVARPMLQRMG